MASYTKFNQFATDVLEKVHNFNSDTFNVGLTNSAPSASSNKVWGDITEISAGNGYSAGGASAGVTLASASGTVTITGTNVTWTATGTIGPFRYVVLYNTSTSPNTKPLVAYWDYGSNVTMGSGDTFTVKFNGGSTSGTLFTMS